MVLDNNLPHSGKWVHLAFTWQRSTGQVLAYIDGNLQENFGHFPHAICLDGSPNIFIGKNEHHGYPFEGYIKHVKIWSRAISSEEISNLPSTSSTSSLIAHWPLTEGVGNIANCISDTTLTGKIVNATWEHSLNYTIPEVVVPEEITIAEWAGRKCQFSNVSFNNIPKTAVAVLPETNLTLSFLYHAYWKYNGNDYCPGCLVQLYYGMGNIWSEGFVEGGVSNHKGSSSKTFTAPKEPGVYYITMSISLMYNYVHVVHNNNSQNAFALVKVVPPIWSPETHHFFPKDIKLNIKTLLLISQLKNDGTPYHPECGLWMVPKDALFLLFSFLW